MAKRDKEGFVDLGRLESEIYEPDPEIKEEFAAAANLGAPRESLRIGLLQPIETNVDGYAHGLESLESAVGEESVGGGNPTPDQDVVEELGEAVGLTYEDNEPLGGEAKLHARDEHRWELNPASSEDSRIRRG